MEEACAGSPCHFGRFRSQGHQPCRVEEGAASREAEELDQTLSGSCEVITVIFCCKK